MSYFFKKESHGEALHKKEASVSGKKEGRVFW